MAKYLILHRLRFWKVATDQALEERLALLRQLETPTEFKIFVEVFEYDKVDKLNRWKGLADG